MVAVPKKDGMPLHFGKILGSYYGTKEVLEQVRHLALLNTESTVTLVLIFGTGRRHS